MKRIRRWLSPTLAVLSLALCAASVALWARSSNTSEWVEWVHGRHFYAASTARGAIALTYSYITNADYPHFAFESVAWPDMNSVYQSEHHPTFWNAFGFRYDDSMRIVYREGDGSTSSGGRCRVQFPLYVAVVFFTLAPLGYGFQIFRHRRRRTQGICPNCGYDLRASPDRCPECGRKSNGGGASAT